MNEILFMILAFILGLALGLLFFGGLWFTIEKTINAKMPGIWVLGSFLLRVSIVMIGFYIISQGSWQRIIICLLGLIAARFMITYLIRLTKSHIEIEVYHEA
jgi:F1F0 ATPase subunit 2